MHLDTGQILEIFNWAGWFPPALGTKLLFGGPDVIGKNFFLND